MSSRKYIEKNIDELRALLIDALTGRAGAFGEVNPKYETLRRRLISLAAILGPLPPFLASSSTIWELWNVYVKGKMSDYESRRAFIKTEFTEYYEMKLNNLGGRSFEEILLFRDIALDDNIGEGGFGIVYKGKHLVLEEPRAIKKLEPLFATEDDEVTALRRFAREANMLFKLNHPNIVRVYDAGMAFDHPFIVMELVEGRNLGKFIDDVGVFSETSSIIVIKDILNAIAAAHAIGIVHRDIKPRNIMWDGIKAVVLDFGAGQWLEFSLSTRMTSAPIGTVGYIAPELYDNPRLLNKNIDCYSVGVLFHYLLTGRIPSTGNSSYYLEEKGISQKTTDFIIKSISPPNMRYQDGIEMLDALTAIS